MTAGVMQAIIAVLTSILSVGAGIWIYREVKQWARSKAQKGLALKAKVDNWQQEVTEFATLLAIAQFPDAAKIAGKISSIAVIQTINALRDLRKKLSEPNGLIVALTENFFWQFPQRVKRADDIDRLAEMVAKEPELMRRVDAIRAKTITVAPTAPGPVTIDVTPTPVAAAK